MLVNSACAGDYIPRIVDSQVDELIARLPAIVFDGARGVGKTTTAMRRAHTIHGLDDPAQRAIAAADPARLLNGSGSILIDEWQYVPECWDLVGAAVDGGAPPGRFLLAGSARPAAREAHSPGRMAGVRMRPLALAERGLAIPTVSLRGLLEGTQGPIAGYTDLRLEDYVREILASGFPVLRGLAESASRAQLGDYLQRIVDHDFPELGRRVRNPAALRRWMIAYAAASSMTVSFETIRDAAVSVHGGRPAKTTTIPYRDALASLWIIDPLPAWLPARSRIARLSTPPKHQLVDPALAARLLGVDADRLLDASQAGPAIGRDGTLLAALFESLVTLSLRVYADASAATVKHLRTASGEHEIDLIVERADGRVIAIEVRLARDASDADTRHFAWLAGRIGDALADAIVITAGADAYRRQDGVAVVPAALLGP